MYHYTYEIKTSSPTDSRDRYIGVRSSKKSPEEDNYYSSCKSFKKWQSINGKDSLSKEVIKTFQTRKEAMEHEVELHKMYDVGVNPKFFNKARSTSNKFFYVAFGKDNPMYNRTHTEEVKQILRDNILNNPNHLCRRRGEDNPNYNRKPSDETRDLWSKQRRGSNNVKSKLTEKDVVVIKTLLEIGEKTQVEIARLFSIAQVTVSHIKRGYRWSHVRVEEY